MSTVVVGREPVVEAWLSRRRDLGQDLRDEVWEGTYHVAPHEHGRNGIVAMELVGALAAAAGRAGLRSGGSFNLGAPDDYRVPDRDHSELLRLTMTAVQSAVDWPDQAG